MIHVFRYYTLIVVVMKRLSKLLCIFFVHKMCTSIPTSILEVGITGADWKAEASASEKTYEIKSDLSN